MKSSIIFGVLVVSTEGLFFQNQTRNFIVSFERSFGPSAKIESFVSSRLKQMPFLQRQSIKVFGFYQNVFQGFIAAMPEPLVAVVKSLPGVEEVEEDHPIDMYATQSDATWGLQRMTQKGPVAPSGPYTYNYNDEAGKGVAVYVIDSGVNIKHNEFEGRAFIGKTFEGDNDRDENGHGSHVAGTIAGKTYGVAKKANIIALKVFDGSGKGSFSNTLNAIEWAIKDMRGTRGNVINMSLGGIHSFSVNRAVEAAYRAGMTVVVAAGNSALDSVLFSPASAYHAITVGATTINDTLASFSNFGLLVDVLAPGQDILSCWNSSRTATKVISGTSMASPHVAGLAALLHSQEKLNNKEVAEKIRKLGVRDAIKGAGLFRLDAGRGFLTTNLMANTGI
ncbi:hypothetical protein DSO57_1025782 [Entomophthora muscae]|uniref:Uncharacterized protein n=2 Tax=Entomophthora muscae TaxID=34485 RepID=A0ACC2SEY3_9FUNG|nr:hypothetical protein DSO57_1007822 [Entomophthora muscae]KAJ9060919.1 hypothetical protein DSO57_1025782 [Entomophthora muscae]